jgi:hypothetical protein
LRLLKEITVDIYAKTSNREFIRALFSSEANEDLLASLLRQLDFDNTEDIHCLELIITDFDHNALEHKLNAKILLGIENVLSGALNPKVIAVLKTKLANNMASNIACFILTHNNHLFSSEDCQFFIETAIQNHSYNLTKLFEKALKRNNKLLLNKLQPYILTHLNQIIQSAHPEWLPYILENYPRMTQNNRLVLLQRILKYQYVRTQLLSVVRRMKNSLDKCRLIYAIFDTLKLTSSRMKKEIKSWVAASNIELILELIKEDRNLKHPSSAFLLSEVLGILKISQAESDERFAEIFMCLSDSEYLPGILTALNNSHTKHIVENLVLAAVQKYGVQKVAKNKPWLCKVFAEPNIFNQLAWYQKLWLFTFNFRLMYSELKKWQHAQPEFTSAPQYSDIGILNKLGITSDALNSSTMDHYVEPNTTLIETSKPSVQIPSPIPEIENIDEDIETHQFNP